MVDIQQVLLGGHMLVLIFFRMVYLLPPLLKLLVELSQLLPCLYFLFLRDIFPF